MVALVRGERKRAKETSSTENTNPNPSIHFPFASCSSLCAVSAATVVIAVRWSSQFGIEGSCKLLLSSAPAIHHNARPSRPAGALHNWAVGGSKPLQSGHSPGLGELCWRAGNSTLTCTHHSLFVANSREQTKFSNLQVPRTICEKHCAKLVEIVRLWHSGCCNIYREYLKRHCFDCSVWDIFLAFWSWDVEYWGPWRFWICFLTRVSLLLGFR